ncbi:hypothetical protein BJX64DRAFT_287868 [Aspergillus heterothallicus]
MGIATSYYTFQPLLRDLEAEKKSGPQLGPGSLPRSQSQPTEQQQPPKAASSPLPVDSTSLKGDDSGAK